MMKYYPKDTLAYFNSAPQFHRNDLRNLPTSTFAAATTKYRENCSLAFPNDEAVTFYVLNHLASIVRSKFTPNEPLPAWAKEVMQTYTAITSGQGLRMLHYILSITTREMRHLNDGYLGSDWWEGVAKVYSVAFRQFLAQICNVNEIAAVEKYMKSPPDCTIGQYIAGLTHGFQKGKWNGGFGGKKWGQVADACNSFIHGKTSMEALVDTGYTLAHNNGPIFNKGMMYSNYDSNFIKILDVQRSGQLPELILDKINYGVKKPSVAIGAVTLVKTALPEVFRGWVDWIQVEKLGSIGKYPQYISAQTAQHPAAPVEKKPVEKVVGGKKIKVVGNWTVFPGKVVEIYERVK